MVVDKGGVLIRVQVKTTSFKQNSKFIVSMTVKGGNRSGIGKIKLFDSTQVDEVFVLTSDQTRYIVPAASIKNYTTLQQRWLIDPR